MSTPAGRSSRIKESTVLGVGSMMSIKRLCVRISKCSRLSLYLCGERITHTTFFSVGSGTGPTTVAPARVTVSTILRAETSMTSWSYDLSRMRIFCAAMLTHSHSRLWQLPRARLVALLLLHHCLSVKSHFWGYYSTDPRTRACRMFSHAKYPKRNVGQIFALAPAGPARLFTAPGVVRARMRE